MAIPIDPSIVTRGAEWSVPGLDAAPTAPEAGGADFGGMLAQQIGRLQTLQDQAAGASQALATGQATDPTAVVMAVEKAQLAMQLASTVRTKAVDALSDVLHTQV